MGSFAADSIALLTTPDELSEDHLKSSADASEVQTFNKPHRENIFSLHQSLTSPRVGMASRISL